jgi:hypothetical protein
VVKWLSLEREKGVAQSTTAAAPRHSLTTHNEPAGLSPAASLCLCPDHLQMAQASKPGLFDHVVDNTEVAPVYHSLKEAISTLSPIIRNRWVGVPDGGLQQQQAVMLNCLQCCCPALYLWWSS